MTEATESDSPTPQADLYAATEEIRAAEFENVPAALLVAVLKAEQSSLDDRAAAAREVSRAVDAWLTDNPIETPGADADEESPS